jgi:DHA2 family multidrug resistance protein-like MFS transporter
LDARIDNAPAADGLDAPRRYWAWTAIILAIVLSVLDGTIANVALPTIAADFHASPAVSIWIVNGYQLAIVIALLPLASLGEIYGYRRIQTAGVIVFTLASAACAFADSLPALTAARIVQGLGAAGMMSVNAAILRYTIPARKFGSAIGINAFVVAVSATVGPTLAGFILTWASWPWLFLINLPLGVAAAVIGWFSLPESDHADRRFDWLSALLSAATIGLAVLVIDSLGHSLPAGWIAAQAVALVVIGVLLVRRELGMADPLLPLDLLKLPVFSMSVGASVTSFVAQMLAFVSLPFMLQSSFGFEPRDVGLLMMPWPLALAVTAPIAGRLSDRYSPAILGGAGLVLLALGLALLALLPDKPSAPDIAWRMVLCGIGFGLFQTPNNRTLIGAAPRRRSGAASGMLGTARLSGQTIGAALVALLLAQAGIAGATLALGVASAFAFVAAIVSIARLGAFRKAEAADRAREARDAAQE